MNTIRTHEAQVFAVGGGTRDRADVDGGHLRQALSLAGVKVLSWRLSLNEGRTVNQSEVLRRALREFLAKYGEPTVTKE